MGRKSPLRIIVTQNHGLCKLSGPIKDAAMKLKQLSESEEGYKCICDCPCETIVKQVSEIKIQLKNIEG